MVSESLSDKARRVLLKLDSGCLIGSAEKLRVSSADATAAVLVDADHSFQLGRLAEKDVQRLEDMLLQMHAKIPGAAPLRTNSSAISSLKRKASDLYQDAATPRAFADANGHHFAGGGYSEPVTPRDESGWAKGQFEHKCLSIMQSCWTEFGEFIIYFNEPVKKSFVPDYYDVIKNPRDLGTIKKNLIRKKYETPQEFYEDMHLFFGNIYTYNGTNSNFGKLGSRVEGLFEERWAASGLSTGAGPRARRFTAGHAATKFEPDVVLPDRSGQLPRTTSGARSGGAPAPARNGKGGSQARSRATEKEMPRETLERIAAQLGSLDGEPLQGALDIIRAATSLAEDGQSDEIELDFDTLDSATLWKLEGYLRSLNPVGAGNGNFNVQDESDSSSSSDSDSD